VINLQLCCNLDSWMDWITDYQNFKSVQLVLWNYSYQLRTVLFSRFIMLNSIICLRHSSDKKTFPYKTVRYLIIKKTNPKLYLCLLRRISYSMYFVCCRIPLCTRDSWVDLPYSRRSWVKEGHCSRTQWVYHRCTRIPWSHHSRYTR